MDGKDLVHAFGYIDPKFFEKAESETFPSAKRKNTEQRVLFRSILIASVVVLAILAYCIAKIF